MAGAPAPRVDETGIAVMGSAAYSAYMILF